MLVIVNEVEIVGISGSVEAATAGMATTFTLVAMRMTTLTMATVAVRHQRG